MNGNKMDSIVILPSKKRMLKKVGTVNFFGMGPKTRPFFEFFIDNISARQTTDGEILVSNIVTAWDFAAQKHLKGLSRHISKRVEQRFESFIEIVAPFIRDEALALRAALKSRRRT